MNEGSGGPTEPREERSTPAAAEGGGEPVTIRRVARLANVSPATVSRVMNRHSSVDPELARRVQQVAAAVGYRPSAVARSLARGRTGIVAIVVPDLGNPMFQAVLRGVSRAAGQEDYRLLVTDSQEMPLEEAILAQESRVRSDGLILCSPRMHDEELAGIASRLSPLVLVNRHVTGLDTPTVSVDYAAGVQALVSHLTWLGHTRVAYLSGPVASVSNRERLDALRALAPERFELIEVECGSMQADGYAAVDRALATGAGVIVGYNDLVALGALGKLHEIGVAVPETVSVVGFDDIPFARYSTPRLTTVSVPQEELGREAWHRLSAMLAERRVPADVRFTPRLEVRASTGPATPNRPR